MTPEQMLSLLLLVADMRSQIGQQQDVIKELTHRIAELEEATGDNDG